MTPEEALAEARKLGDEVADALTLRTHGAKHPREEAILAAWDELSFTKLRQLLKKS